MTASVHQTEHLLFFVLVQLIVMIGAARLLNTAFRRLGQPGVIGEIVAGLLLGPSLFGHFLPGLSATVFGTSASPAIVILSQIGLILLMFQIGTDFEFGHLKASRNRRATLTVAVASICVPFALGLIIGEASASTLAPGVDPLVYSLFLGVALAITAVPILGRILREYGLNQTEIGVVAISAAAINDVVGWILLAGVSAYATARFTTASLGLTLAGLVLLVAVLWFLLRPLADRLLRLMPVHRDAVPPNLMAIVLCLIFVLAIWTFQIGIFAIFGGFAAGLLFHRHPGFVEAWRRQVGQFVLVFFLPIFFTFTGLHTNVLGLTGASDWVWTLVFVAVSIASKVVPITVVAVACGYTAWEGLLTGVLMNTRALMELIVLNIGLETGFLPQKVFTMLVIMAVVTTVMTGPLLTLIMARIGLAVSKPIEA